MDYLFFFYQFFFRHSLYDIINDFLLGRIGFQICHCFNEFARKVLIKSSSFSSTILLLWINSISSGKNMLTSFQGLIQRFWQQADFDV